jgi:accessory gene regulator protein AgrB
MNWKFVLSLHVTHGRTVVLSMKFMRGYHAIKQNKSSLQCCLSTLINYNLFYYVTSNIIINPSICYVYHYLYIALW